MRLRKLMIPAATLGMFLVGTGMAQDATTAPSKAVDAKQAQVNQDMADAVKKALLDAGVVNGAKIGISVKDGVCSLTGTAMDGTQHNNILKTVATLRSKGLRRIESEVTYPQEMPRKIQQTGGQVPAGPGPSTLPDSSGMPMIGAAPPTPGVPMPPQGMPAFNTNEPVPLNGGMGMMPLDPAAPKLPPYAWPTYAPYNNYSRVAYPASYPHNAFPYIGPYYPFPRVPLGWRKVVLEWDDGHWYLGRLAGPYNYWKVRFW